MKIKIEDIKLVRATPDGKVVYYLRDGQEIATPNRKGRQNVDIIK
jgi:hypothetical protein